MSGPSKLLELLERHHDGLVATSGCLGSAVCQRLLKGDYQGALDTAASLFGGLLGTAADIGRKAHSAAWEKQR